MRRHLERQNKLQKAFFPKVPSNPELSQKQFLQKANPTVVTLDAKEPAYTKEVTPVFPYLFTNLFVEKDFSEN